MFDQMQAYSQLIEASTVPQILCRDDGTIIHLNSIFTTIFGYKLDEVPTVESIAGLFCQDSEKSKGIVKSWDTYTKEKTEGEIAGKFHVQLCCKDSTRKAVDIEYTSLNRGNEPLILITIIESEAQFKGLFIHAADAIFIADTESGKIVEANISAEKLMQKTADELTGIHYSELHPADRKEFSIKKFEQVQKELEHVSTSTPYEHVILRADGEEIPVEILVTDVMYKGEKCMMGTFRNISRRKKIEIQLKQNEERLQQIATINQSVIWEIDTDGVYQYVSHMAKEVWGYMPDELVGKRAYFDLHPKEGREEFVLQTRRLIEKKEPFQDFLNQIQKPDGTIIRVSTNGTPIYDAEGDLTGYRGSDQDVTARLHAEKALSDSTGLMTKLAEQVPGVVYQFKLRQDGSTCFPYSSPGMSDIYAYTPQEVQEDATPVFNRLHPEDRDWVTEEIYKSAETLELFHCEFRVQLPGKDIEWRLSNARPERLEDGSTLWHGIITDITDRKKAEEEIRKLSEAVEQSPVSVVITDVKGKIEYVNPKFEKLTGYSLEEAKGNNPNILQSGYQGKKFYDKLWDTITSGKVWRGQFRNKKKSGELYWESATISPIKDKEGVTTHYLAVKEDITRRRNIEVKLRQSEQRYRSIIAVSNTGAWEYDMENEQLWCSDEYFSMLGYRREDVDVDGETGFSLWKRFIHPDDREEAVKMAIDYTAGDMIDGYENYFRMIDKNGSPVWIWARGENLKNPDGSPTKYFLGTHIDITQIRLAEEELKSAFSEMEVLKDALNSVPVAVYMKDKYSMYTFANRLALDLFDCSESELEGSSDFRFFDEETAKSLREIDQKVFAGEFINQEVKTIDSKGNEKYYLEIKSPIYTEKNELVGLLGISTDITEMKRAERKIRESEEYLQILFRAIPDMIFVVDKEGVFLDYKTESKDLYVNPDIFLGKKVAEVLPADVAEKHRIATEKALTSAELVEIDYSLAMKGKQRHFKSRIVALGDDKVLSMITEATEAVNNLNKIKSLLNEKEEQNKRLVNFTHIVSHNLRSHTANMQGLFGVLELEDPEVMQNQYIQLIKDSALNLNETIAHLNEVLDISLSNKEKRSVVYIRKTVKSVTESISSLAKSAGVTIENKIPKDVRIMAIPAYVDSMVLNLLTNAIKFRSEERKSFIEITAEISNKWLILNFRDNGLGIDLKRHGDKLFSMYKTFHGHPESKGLGLFITKNQVEAMGGKIKAESEVDRGSTFKIILPHEKI